MASRTYFCIDLKSFYASVECIERGLDPMTTNLVVADPERGDKTICLAITPPMKALGVKNRCRIFEIPKQIQYMVASPRMQRYIDYAAEIYAIYLEYAWGREPVTIADIKSYRPKTNSLTSGQVLMRDYSFEEGKLIVREMMDLLCLDMLSKSLCTNSITLCDTVSIKLFSMSRSNFASPTWSSASPPAKETGRCTIPKPFDVITTCSRGSELRIKQPIEAARPSITTFIFIEDLLRALPITFPSNTDPP